MHCSYPRRNEAKLAAKLDLASGRTSRWRLKLIGPQVSCGNNKSSTEVQSVSEQHRSDQCNQYLVFTWGLDHS